MYREENQIERHLALSTKKRGGLCFNLISTVNNGVPDRIVLLPGYVPMFIELKAPGKKPRPLQEAVMRMIQSTGCRCHVVWLDSMAAVDALMAGYDVSQRRGGA